MIIFKSKLFTLWSNKPCHLDTNPVSDPMGKVDDRWLGMNYYCNMQYYIDKRETFPPSTAKFSNVPFISHPSTHTSPA